MNIPLPLTKKLEELPAQPSLIIRPVDDGFFETNSDLVSVFDPVQNIRYVRRSFWDHSREMRALIAGSNEPILLKSDFSL